MATVVDLSKTAFPISKCTKDQYESLDNKDPNKIYLITDAEVGDANIFLGNKVLAREIVPATYTDSQGSSIELGGFTQGMTAQDMSFQEFAYRLLHPNYSPSLVTFTSDLPKTIYESGESIASVELTTNVDRGSSDIISVAFYCNGILLHEYTNISNNVSTFSYTYTPETPITSSINLYSKVRCIGESTGTFEIVKTIPVTFNAPTVIYSYHGTLADEIYPVTAADVKGLTATVRSSREFSYVNPIVEYGRIIYAYPATFGELTNIKDGNGFNYSESYTKSNIQIDGTVYYLYILTDSTTLEEGDVFTQIFS